MGITSTYDGGCAFGEVYATPRKPGQSYIVLSYACCCGCQDAEVWYVNLKL